MKTYKNGSSISEHDTEFILESPDGQYRAVYCGHEIGMSAPTYGNVDVRTKQGVPVYSSECWAKMCFSSDSKYLTIARGSRMPKKIKVELPSGREGVG